MTGPNQSFFLGFHSTNVLHFNLGTWEGVFICESRRLGSSEEVYRVERRRLAGRNDAPIVKMFTGLSGWKFHHSANSQMLLEMLPMRRYADLQTKK